MMIIMIMIIIIIGFRNRFSQCVDYMRVNEKKFCFRWQETTRLVLFGNTKTSSLVILCDVKYLTGNISPEKTIHMGVKHKLHRFAYLIVQIIWCFYLYFSHAIPSLYVSSFSPKPEINTGNFAPAEMMMMMIIIIMIIIIVIMIIITTNTSRLLVLNRIKDLFLVKQHFIFGNSVFIEVK